MTSNATALQPNSNHIALSQYAHPASGSPVYTTPAATRYGLHRPRPPPELNAHRAPTDYLSCLKRHRFLPGYDYEITTGTVKHITADRVIYPSQQSAVQVHRLNQFRLAHDLLAFSLTYREHICRNVYNSKLSVCNDHLPILQQP